MTEQEQRLVDEFMQRITEPDPFWGKAREYWMVGRDRIGIAVGKRSEDVTLADARALARLLEERHGLLTLCKPTASDIVLAASYKSMHLMGLSLGM